jgi:hypothetical protein
MYSASSSSRPSGSVRPVLMIIRGTATTIVAQTETVAQCNHSDVSRQGHDSGVWRLFSTVQQPDLVDQSEQKSGSQSEQQPSVQ